MQRDDLRLFISLVAEHRVTFISREPQFYPFMYRVMFRDDSTYLFQ